jgi:hypothetical protein
VQLEFKEFTLLCRYTVYKNIGILKFGTWKNGNLDNKCPYLYLLALKDTMRGEGVNGIRVKIDK